MQVSVLAVWQPVRHVGPVAVAFSFMTGSREVTGAIDRPERRN